jgi:putative acetyltransferase
VIVLGHRDYYPRFGFVPASRFGISPPFEVPDGVFFAMELYPGSLQGVIGMVEYPPEFAEAEA